MPTEWVSEFQPADLIWVCLNIVVISALYVPGMLAASTADPPGRNFVFRTALAVGVLCVGWCLFGYTLAFSPSAGTVPNTSTTSESAMKDMQAMMEFEHARPDLTRDMGKGGLIGNGDAVGMLGTGPSGDNEVVNYPVRLPYPHLPQSSVAICHMSIMIAFASLWLSNAASRFGTSHLVICSLLWQLIVYCPVAHWIWGNGWFSHSGGWDGGGALILLGASLSCVAACSLTGRRFDAEESFGCTRRIVGMTCCVLGALFVNAAYSLSISPLITIIWMNTLVSVASGALVSVFMKQRLTGTSDLESMILGMVSGMAAIASGAGVLSVQAAFIVGGVAGGLVPLTSILLHRNASQMVVLFGVAAAVGMLLTGVFASSINGPVQPGGRLVTGWIESGNFELLLMQAKGIGATVLLSLVAAFLISGLVLLTGGMKAVPECQPE
ncbi:MAG: hypothetical protein KDA91_06435 [Planctomycetaceae bacterium]|nr:hypothetical protein [Planctomycetaceae bacterium]